jgi:hypothetical protein
MTAPIYIVSYARGEDSDYTEWPVAWYPTRDEAEAHKAQFDAALQAVCTARAAWSRVNPRRPMSTAALAQPAIAAWYEADGVFLSTDPAVARLGELLGGKFSSYWQIQDLYEASVSEVPRGTLPLHGLQP